MYVTRQNRVQRPPREMTGMGEAQSSSAVTRMVVPRAVSLNCHPRGTDLPVVDACWAMLSKRFTRGL